MESAAAHLLPVRGNDPRCTSPSIPHFPPPFLPPRFSIIHQIPLPHLIPHRSSILDLEILARLIALAPLDRRSSSRDYTHTTTPLRASQLSPTNAQVLIIPRPFLIPHGAPTLFKQTHYRSSTSATSLTTVYDTSIHTQLNATKSA